MYRSRANTSPGLAALLILPLLITPVSSAWTYSYCSKQNTAGDFSVCQYAAHLALLLLTNLVNDDWQSNGWCHDRCKERGNYAFAVIRYKDCWCSDYIPADQSDVSDCSETCPGFPSEKCGNEDEGLYLYLKLDGTPSGTAGGSKPTASVSSSSTRSSSRSPPPEATTVSTARFLVSGSLILHVILNIFFFLSSSTVVVHLSRFCLDFSLPHSLLSAFLGDVVVDFM